MRHALEPPICMGIGLIPVVLTNIHNWRFGRSFARPVPGSDLAGNAPARRAGASPAVGHTGSSVGPLAHGVHSSAGHAWLCVVSAWSAPASPLPRLRPPRRGRAATATGTALRVRPANPGAGPDGCPGINAPSVMATRHPAIPSRMQGRRYAVAFPGRVGGSALSSENAWLQVQQR